MAGALSLTPSPARAANTLVTVTDTFPDAPITKVDVASCAGSYYTAPGASVSRGYSGTGSQVLGSSAWTLQTSASGVGAGLFHQFPSIDQTTVMGVHLRSDTGSTGVVRVFFHPVRETTTFWEGKASFAVGASWTELNTASPTFTWTQRKLSDNTATGTVAPDATLMAFALNYFQAHVGDDVNGPLGVSVLAGCAADKVYVDDLIVSHDFQTTTYDLEAPPSAPAPPSATQAPTVTAKVRKAKVTAGKKVTVSGTVAPAQPGVTVTLFAKVKSGQDKKVGSAVLSSAGTYTVTFKARKPGTLSLYVALPGSGGQGAVTSGQVTVKVKPKPKPKPQHH